MTARNMELDSYIKAGGIGRVALNAMCFIGVFIFGWLLPIAFNMLGKKGTGWWYIVPVIVLSALSRNAAPSLFFVAIAIYIAGWIHANVALSRVQSLARDRISELRRLGDVGRSADTLLEEGLLQSRALREKELGAAMMAAALRLPDGDPVLLNQAGGAMAASKRYAEAKEFFQRVLASGRDEALLKQARQSLAAVEKKL